MTKAQKNYIEYIKKNGWIEVSKIDQMMYMRRNSLMDLVKKGVIVSYWASPSYYGYRLP